MPCRNLIITSNYKTRQCSLFPLVKMINHEYSVWELPECCGTSLLASEGSERSGIDIPE